MGVHIGETEERDGDYFGPVLNLTARLEAAGHGGQTLITDQARTAARLQDTTTDLGTHHLKDVPQQVRIHQLGDTQFPDLRTVAGSMQGATVTFLFTDIEASTQRWQQDVAAMSVQLAAHDALLTSAVEDAGGRVFKHTGDGICAVFGSPRNAVEAAIAVQSELRLPVRMGLHTGEAEERDGDFFGPTLNRCARIMDAGHGGQILCSAATRGLIDGVEVVDLGEHELKGLSAAEHIFQVGAGRFPALRSMERAKMLPVVLTSLIGRDRLVEDIVARIATSRLVTLVGFAGVGKTRVAVAAAGRVADGYDACAFVDLTEVSNDTDVVAAVAAALGAKLPTVDSVTAALSARSVLMVVDNCEHVIDGVADLVESLLGLTGCRILATSREGLAVDGEQLVAVSGLGVDDADSAGVGLFIDRATSADPSFVADADEIGLIAEICGRLDGLPLAIELAAARVGVLTPRQILDRLDDRFQLLTGGRRRRSKDRQRTLREAVDWSYELLAKDEQRALARLSAFAGGFGLDGAAAVLDDLDEMNVLDTVEALVDKSLLTVADVAGVRRYRYLETIRSYAEDRLQDRDDGQVIDLMHQHLVAVVRDAVDEHLRRSRRGADRLDIETPNLRRSFDDMIDRGDIDAAAELIIPYLIATSIDWRIAGWADELLALPAATGSTFELELQMLSGIDASLDGRFHDLNAIALRAKPVAQTDEVSDGVLYAMAFCNAMVANYPVASRCVAIMHAQSDDTDLLLLARLNLYAHRYVPSPPGTHIALPPDIDIDIDADINSAVVHPSPVIRTAALVAAALRAYTVGDYDSMLQHSQAGTHAGIPGSGLWFANLQIGAWAHYLTGDLAAAIRSADYDLDEAHRFGDRSAMIMPTMIYALVLRAVDEPEAAATVRGALPRRFTLLMVAELIELDRWLTQQLEPERLTELATRGRSVDRRATQTFAHEVFARHLS